MNAIISRSGVILSGVEIGAATALAIRGSVKIDGVDATDLTDA